MLNPGREGFFYSWSEKKTASTNRADGSCGNHNLRGLAPSLYMAKIEHEQLEHLNTVNDIGG